MEDQDQESRFGAIAGVGILFLIVSGLPWTGLWGEKVQEIAAPRGMSLWGEDPGATSTLKESIEGASSSSAPAGWAIGETEVPSSTGHNHGGGAATGSWPAARSRCRRRANNLSFAAWSAGDAAEVHVSMQLHRPVQPSTANRYAYRTPLVS